MDDTQFSMDNTQLLERPFNLDPPWIDHFKMLEKLYRSDGTIPCFCHAINKENNVIVIITIGCLNFNDITD